ncbi:MAG: heat-inducible transcription repressor HrcA [Candidatus Latescibacteria bacterium]|nr:heat-inducible transcription repressor HrcA [Candidatus Latescibacterota bacterium]
MKTALSDREWLVLQALVKAHTATGAPIGSSTLAVEGKLGISSATVRNILVALENKGCVRQPHTSAGRIPTDKGYRCYVEEGMVAERFLQEEGGAMVQEELDRKMPLTNDQILLQLARVIGDISQHLGVVMASRFEQGIFHKLELSRLSAHRLLVVVSIEQGLVKSLVTRLDTQVSQPELEEICRRLNERLSGLSMAQIRYSLGRRVESLPVKYRPLLRRLVDDVADLTYAGSADLHVAGAHYLCQQPEFRDGGKMAELMEMVEHRDSLAGLLRERQGMVITIGREHQSSAMRTCSLVTSSYEVNGARGVIGVIGPTRMPYGRMVALVQHAASRAASLAAS